MIRLLILILLMAAPVQAAFDITVQVDQTGSTLIDENGLWLIDEKGLPAITSDVVIITRAPSSAEMPVAEPGHETDICSTAMLVTPVLKDPTPFLYTDSPSWMQPFYAMPGQPWATKLELVRYDDGNVDYSGFEFETVFQSTGAAPIPLNVQTHLVETITDGVVTATVQNDYPWWHMTPQPFNIPAGTTWPLPANWKTIHDPCYMISDRTLEICRITHGIWPVETTGDASNGTRTYQFQRIVYYDIAPYYNNVIPVTATVIATPGYINISMTAEQTEEMAGWFGKLQLIVLYPEWERIPGNDNPPKTYSRNYLNGLPMILLPQP